MGNYRLRDRDVVVLMKTNDVFSDDDLKRLKLDIQTGGVEWRAPFFHSLLARLEAAEACIESHLKIWDVKVWRKSKGELK
jgi:hypothetical protein